MNKLYFFSDQFSPRNASVNWDPEQDLPEETEAFFEEYNKLPLFLRFGLGSDLAREKVYLLAKKFDWEKDEKKVGEISRLVRDVFLRNLREADLLLRIKEKLSLFGKERLLFYQNIKKIAFLVKKEGEKEFAEDFFWWPINKIINTYPETLQQKIGYLPIFLENNQVPMMPSIENWFQDYLLKTGVKKHNLLERSRYLFEGENSKKLDSTERKKLGILLKSYDEGINLVLDKRDKKLELEESLKIDQEWLTALDFFLTQDLKEENLFLEKKPLIFVKQDYGKEEKKDFSSFKRRIAQPFKDKEKKELKNVLDLSQLV